jgi:cyclopropane fatty-acyl-phospholipid synthase-like methyltransferase
MRGGIVSRSPGRHGRRPWLGFGPASQRMWNLHLAYSEAGFRARYLDVHQLILERPS